MGNSYADNASLIGVRAAIISGSAQVLALMRVFVQPRRAIGGVRLVADTFECADGWPRLSFFAAFSAEAYRVVRSGG